MKKTKKGGPTKRTVGDVTIDSGAITYKGKPVGSLMHALKHGYHPVVRLTLGDSVKDYELDTPDLIDTVFEVVEEKLGGMAS